MTIICENIPQFSQVLIMIYGSLAGVTLIAKGIQKLVETGQTAVSSYDQHKLNELELEKKKIEIEILKQEQNYKKTMESIDYEKSLAELRKLTLEVEEMEKQAGKYRKILMDNGIEISVQHNSKNLKNAPFHEVIHYNQ